MARILVIEDDRIYREMIVEALESEGYEALTAEDGLKGIERARAYRPDLVITDVVMDKADGYKVLSTLKSEPATMGIPTILITGWSSKGGQRQGMAMGADDYLAKPFNATELLQSIKAQLKKREHIETLGAARSEGASAAMMIAIPTELTPPLQTILGFADVLENGDYSISRHEAAEIGRGIRESARRMLRSLQNQLLWFQLTQLEQDEEQLRALRGSVTDGLRSVAESIVRKLAAAEGREADVQLTLNDGSAAIARPYFERLVTELVDNALKFSPSGSPIHVVLAFKSDRLGFSISDRGLGMSADVMAQLDAFRQFGRSAYGQTGLGLGLAISRKIAELHGGVLTIRSRPGEGSRIVVELAR